MDSPCWPGPLLSPQQASVPPTLGLAGPSDPAQARAYFTGLCPFLRPTGVEPLPCLLPGSPHGAFALCSHPTIHSGEDVPTSPAAMPPCLTCLVSRRKLTTSRSRLALSTPSSFYPEPR